MSTENLDSSGWCVFRLFLCQLEDLELETVYQQLVSEIESRDACDLHCARLFFSSLTSHDLDMAREQLLVERTERAEDAKVLEQSARDRRAPFPDRLDSGFSPGPSAQTQLAYSRHKSDECVDRAGRCGKQEKTRMMPTYAITEDNRIKTVDRTEEIAATNAPVFDSLIELGRIAAAWPLPRLVEIYNGLTGNQQRRFANRKQAVERIWAALKAQPGESNDRPEPLKTGARSNKKPKKAKSKRNATPSKTKPSAAKKPATAKKDGHPHSKKSTVIAMLKHKRPVTLSDIMAATGWQAHTVRALLSTLSSKDGYKIESAKSAKGLRTYRITK